MKALLTPAQVGERLGVNRDTARRYMRNQMTCVILPGGDIRVEESELEAWTQGRRVAPAQIAREPRARRKPAPVIDLALFEPDGRIKRRRSRKNTG
jgi:hypothetical protein